MSSKTKIQWTDVSWNPVRGCSLISDGCTNCYAMKTAHRFSKPGMAYEGLTEIGPQGPRWNGKIMLVPDALEEPLHWKTPRRVFVNSMSDLFHPDIDHEFLLKIFAIMALTPQHTYQILTKRPARMQDKLSLNRFRNAVISEAWSMLGKLPKFEHQGITKRPWPLPNVWLGVTVENQETADERIPILLQTTAAVRWISAEPLLCPIDLTRLPVPETALLPEYGTSHGFRFNALHRDDDTYTHSTKHHLDWIIIGGESGPGARPCDLSWIRSIKDQCQAAGVPVFIKQLGARWYDQTARVGIRGSIAVPVDAPPWTWINQQDRKGGALEDTEFPEDLKVREWPR